LPPFLRRDTEYVYQVCIPRIHPRDPRRRSNLRTRVKDACESAGVGTGRHREGGAMRWVIVGGLVTLLSAALGWIGFGHLAVLLGLEILVGVWFARLRTIDSLGPVTAGHATRTTYVVTVDGEKVQQEFNPVPGQPLSAR